MITRWKEYRKAKKDAKELEAKKEEEDLIKHVQGIHEKIKASMISSPCPIRGENCSDDCVHFDEAERYIIDFNGFIRCGGNPPQCKLWKQ